MKAEARRFNVLDAGRRWGKNVLLRDVLIEPALAGYPVAWFAPTYKMLAADWRGMKAMLAPVTSHKLEQEHRLALVTGGNVDMWSLDQPDSARGRKYKRVAINEAAQVAGLQDAWEQVIRATLTDLAGDGWFGSTPRGHGYFWALWQRGRDAAGWPDWMSWQFPTASNPFIAGTEIDAARQELPERVFAQEYMADFIENEGAVFRNILACLHAPPVTPEEHAKLEKRWDKTEKREVPDPHRIVMGADWGKQNDFTAISIVCQRCKRELEHDRFNQIDYHFQRDRLIQLATKWHVGRIVAEKNAMGDPIIEELGRDKALNGVGITAFDTLPSTKPQLIESLALAFEQAECQWLDDPVWTGELEAYERKMSAITGRSTYSAPSGMHDDTVMARALAWHGCVGGEVTSEPNTIYD